MPRRKLPPNSQVITDYQKGSSTGELAEKYGVAPSTVVSLLRRLDVPRRNPKDAARIRTEHRRFKITKYWQGKKQPPEMVEKRASKTRGEKHYLWKGGYNRRGYRNVIDKQKCVTCNITQNLSIHHIDFDHYNNTPENLQVLCVSCHMRLHKLAYWKAIRNGYKYQKSNAPIGWEKDKS